MSNNNQSIIGFNKYIEILLLKKLLNKGYINKATYNKIRENYMSNRKEVA